MLSLSFAWSRVLLRLARGTSCAWSCAWCTVYALLLRLELCCTRGALLCKWYPGPSAWCRCARAALLYGTLLCIWYPGPSARGAVVRVLLAWCCFFSWCVTMRSVSFLFGAHPSPKTEPFDFRSAMLLRVGRGALEYSCLAPGVLSAHGACCPAALSPNHTHTRSSGRAALLCASIVLVLLGALLCSAVLVVLCAWCSCTLRFVLYYARGALLRACCSTVRVVLCSALLRSAILVLL